MDSYVISGLILILSGAVSYFIKVLVMERIDMLEQQMPTKMTEAETRLLLSDKIEPIKESMTEIKEKVDKVIDLLITNAKN